MNTAVTHYEWQPQEDITTYELALCLVPLAAYIAGHNVEVEMIEALPQSALRHFKVVESLYAVER